MIDRPDARSLLDAVADALSTTVLTALEPDREPVASGPEVAAARYTAQVAANLCRILSREVELGPDATAATVNELRVLLGRVDGDLVELVAALDDRLRDRPGDLDPIAVHRVLTANVGRRLDIARPSYRRPDRSEEVR